MPVRPVSEQQQIAAPLSQMAATCNSCAECVRTCTFLQQQGTPAAIAGRGHAESNLLSAFGCTLCGLCDAVCPEGLSPSAMLHAMREEAQDRHLVGIKRYSPWLNYEKLGSHALLRRDLIPVGCSTVFFPGCSLPGSRPDAVRGLYRMLRQHDPAVGLVLDCCGKISHDLGLTERFHGVFKRFADRLHKHGITRILTACPGCNKILRRYAEQFEVVSVYEALLEEQQAGAKGQGALKNEAIDSNLAAGRLPRGAVVIHDPCPARFDTAQQSAVRQLVASCGYQVEELASHGTHTRCCGQGGMVEGCIPGTIKQESRTIAAETAGRPVISFCGSCCETLAATTPTAHVADLVTGATGFSNRPVPSLRRWINRLKLRFSRLP